MGSGSESPSLSLLLTLFSNRCSAELFFDQSTHLACCSHLASFTHAYRAHVRRRGASRFHLCRHPHHRCTCLRFLHRWRARLPLPSAGLGLGLTLIVLPFFFALVASSSIFAHRHCSTCGALGLNHWSCARQALRSQCLALHEHHLFALKLLACSKCHIGGL